MDKIQTYECVKMTTKIETAAHMEEKIRTLTRRITELSIPWYERSTTEAQLRLIEMMAELESRMLKYRAYEIPWDSKLIDAIGNVESVKFKTQEISTFDSVMDQARKIFVFINQPEVCP